MRRLWRVVIPVVVVAAGCGGGSTSSSTSASSSSSSTSAAPTTAAPTTAPPTPAAPAKGPATAQFTFVGDAGVAGTVTPYLLTCNFPEVDGTTTIRALANTPDKSALFNMTLSANKISIFLGAGAASTLVSRTFEGAVTNFDASKGVRIDTTLTETTAASTNRGAMKAITSLKATVDCGNQTTGTSTVVITGTTADGAVSGSISPFVVTCTTTAQGETVSYTGILTVGGKKGDMPMTINADSISVFVPPTFHRYLVQSAGVATLTATGAHLQGDAVEQNVSSGPPHTLHIEGDLTCGIIATG